MIIPNSSGPARSSSPASSARVRSGFNIAKGEGPPHVSITVSVCHPIMPCYLSLGFLA